jgi:hypothetical protein
MPPPVITSINPTSGPVGTLVNIYGHNFNNVGFVYFNITQGNVTYYSSTHIIAYVPPGATTGNVVVTTMGLGSNGVLFTVSGSPGAPTIASLTPNTGPTGTSVVIAGTNFGVMQNTSTVTVNGILATVTAWSPTSLTITVPTLAATGPVIVTVNGVASNSMTFTVTTPSNGGYVGPLNLLLIPAQNFTTATFYTLDPTNFNDPSSPSSYSWKVEDVIAGRTPTISRVIISHRDLGVATITMTLSGTDDFGAIVSSSTPVTLGTVAASGKIITQVIGLAQTGQNLQLSVFREANAGPVSITKIRMEGRVDTKPYA